MRTVRQMASGLVYAIVSLLLVIGSLALALAQAGNAGTPAPPPTAIPSSTKTRLAASSPTAVLPSPTATNVIGVGTSTVTASPTLTPGQALATSTYVYPTLAATPRSTSTRSIACGPYSGWVRGYVVQPGDTLFRIATMYGITVAKLQHANCLSGTLIYAGERLWVPYSLPPPTALTIIPTFDTPTEPAATSEIASSTSAPTGTVDP